MTASRPPWATTTTRRSPTDHHHGLAPGPKPHETPWVVWLPWSCWPFPRSSSVISPSNPCSTATTSEGAIHIDHHAHGSMEHLAEHFHGAAAMGVHALTTLPFFLAFAGSPCRGSST